MAEQGNLPPVSGPPSPTFENEPRARRFTEKGLQYNLEIKARDMASIFTRLRVKYDIMSNLMSGVNAELMKEKYSEWLNLYENYLCARKDYLLILPEDEDGSFRCREQEYTLTEMKATIEQWFAQTYSNRSETGDDIKFGDSASQISKMRFKVAGSHVSRVSRVSSARLSEEQRKAELKTRASALKTKQDIELARFKLKLQEEQLEMDTELAIVDAKTQILDRFEKLDIDKDEWFQKSDIGQVERVQKIDTGKDETKSECYSFLSDVHKTKPMSHLFVHETKPMSHLHIHETKPMSHAVDHETKPMSHVHIPETKPMSHAVDHETKPMSHVVKSENILPQFPSSNRPPFDNFVGSRNVNAPYFHPQTPVHVHPPVVPNTQYVSEVNHAFVSVIKQLKKPTPEIKSFDGDPLEYRKFMRQFNIKIVQNSETNDEKMSYLDQYTKGEANKIISGYAYLDSDQGYPAAIQELEERYGNVEVVANAFVKKALNWPIVKPNNAKGLDEYATFLTECSNAVKGITSVKVLEYPDSMKKLVQKLPFNLHDKWRNIVRRLKDGNEEVRFHHLVSFVREEAKKSNDPIYGKDALWVEPKVPGKSQKQSTPFKPKGVYATVPTVDESKAAKEVPTSHAESNDYRGTAFVKPCIFCSSDRHALVECNKIQSGEYEQRISFLKSKGLCYGCLSKGHQCRFCRKKAVCSLCKGRHPTICHSDKRFFLREQCDGKQKPPMVIQQVLVLAFHKSPGIL